MKMPSCVGSPSTEGLPPLLPAMKLRVEKTFCLLPANTDQLICNADDRAFLQSMKGDRSASFGTFDKALSDKFKRREKRTQSESDRRQRMLQDAAIPSVAIEPPMTVASSSSKEVTLAPKINTPTPTATAKINTPTPTKHGCCT